MTKNEDGYIDFAIDDANKENQNVGNTGHGKRKLPSGHDRFVSIASLTPFMNKWTIKGNNIIRLNIIILHYWYCIFFSSSNSKRWNDNTETSRRICKALQFHCNGRIWWFEDYCFQRRRRQVSYSLARRFVFFHMISFRLEPIIKVGECFTISNGVLKNKNTQCNNTASDYELTLVRSTVIEPCDGNDE